MFNTTITGSRRFAAQVWPIERLRAVGKASGTTLNDVVLALVSGALRTYLSEREGVPKKPMIAQIPVSTIAFGTDYGTLDLDGERVPVPVDRATLEEIADQTGGSYSEAASAAELEQVYQDLGSQIGYTTEPRDVSYWFVRGGVLFALLGVVLSLLWTNRLL